MVAKDVAGKGEEPVLKRTLFRFERAYFFYESQEKLTDLMLALGGIAC